MKKVFASAFAVLLLVGCGSDEPETPTATKPPAPSGPEYKGVKLIAGEHNVTVKTDLGEFKVKLNADIAPKTVTNFVKHVENGFYDGLTFHGALPNFLVQGGDPKGDGTGGESIWGEGFERELHPTMKMERGAVAMASKGEKGLTSQFFIVLDAKKAKRLEGNYTVFGMVTEGIEVVEQISQAPTDPETVLNPPIKFEVDAL